MDVALHLLTTVLARIAHLAGMVPNGTWQAIGSAFILSPTFTGIKKWLEIESTRRYVVHLFWIKKLEVRFTGEQIMFTVVMASSWAVAAVHYLLTTPTVNPGIIALQGSVVAFTTQSIYFFFFKPIWMKLGTLLSIRADQKANLQSAIIPASGLPLYLQGNALGPIGPKATEVTPMAVPKNVDSFTL